MSCILKFAFIKPQKLMQLNLILSLDASTDLPFKSLQHDQDSATIDIDSDGRLGSLEISSLFPCVQLFHAGKGILHLIKSQDHEVSSSTFAAILAVPCYMTPPDLLLFIASAPISHVYLINDALPNRYMAIIQLKDSDSRNGFIKEFNGL